MNEKKKKFFSFISHENYVRRNSSSSHVLMLLQTIQLYDLAKLSVLSLD
jgi:hypothetical protein